MRARAIAALTLFLVACRSPTQIEVTVTTDLPCDRVGDTAVTVGRLVDLEPSPPATTSTTCIDDRVGAVVIVPSGDEDSPIAFRIVTAIDGQPVDSCTAPGYGDKCIVARRSLHFIAHEPLEVPVIMRGVCAGRCDDPTTTCVKGACVPATIDPSLCEGPNGCDEGALGGGDDGGASDAGHDATVPTDASSTDGSPTDAPIDAPVDAPIAFDASVLGCDLTGAQAGSPKPMWYQCPSHRNRSPIVGPSSAPTQRWTRIIVGGIGAAPSVARDGTLYVGNVGSVDAIFPADGGTRWSYPLDGGYFAGTPIIAADETLRVFDQPNFSYTSLDLATGSPVSPAFVSQLADPTRGSPTIIGDGTIYYSATTGKLVAIDSSGNLKWVVPNSTSDFVGVTVAADGTVIAATDDAVAAFHPDGGPAWSTTESDAQAITIGTAEIAPDGTLRVASLNDGDLMSLAADGTPGWRQHLVPGGNFIQIAIADDGTTYAGTENGIAGFGPDGGSIGTFADNCGQPVIDAAGFVYAHCVDKLVRLDKTLHQTWSVPCPDFSGTAVTVIDSPVLAQDGRIFLAFDNQNPGPDGGPPDEIIGFGP